MRQQLARLGVTDVGVISPSESATELAAISGALRGRTLLVDADLLLADACLAQLVDGREVRSGALVVDGPNPRSLPARPHADEPDPGAATADPALIATSFESVAGSTEARTVGATVATVTGPDPSEGVGAGSGPWGRLTSVRSAHDRIVSAGSDVHRVSDPNQAVLGALVIDAGDRDHAARVLTAAADTTRFAGWDVDPIDLALVALVRGQVAMGAVPAVGPVLRGGSEEQRAQVSAELAALDESRRVLERAQGTGDSLYGRLALRHVSRVVTPVALGLRLLPSPITLVSLVVGLGAAAAFAVGTRPALLAGAVLLQVALVLGRVAGEVARSARSSSALGAWLAAAARPVVEFAAYAGLALGASRSGQALWMLATAVMAVETVRRVADQGFSQVAHVRETWVSARPLLDTSDEGAASVEQPEPRRIRGSAERRIRRVVELPHLTYDERWLVLGVGVVAVGPRTTMQVLLALGLLALVVRTAARVLWSLRWTDPPQRSGGWLLGPQLDLGPLGEPLWNVTLARLRPLTRSIGWAWPVAMRAVELGVVWVVVSRVAPAQAAWLFAWTFVVALHHHDLLHRVLAGSPAPRWLSWFGLGWDGRTILVLFAGWSGAASVGALLHVGTPPLALLFIVVSSIQWVRSLGRIRRTAADA